MTIPGIPVIYYGDEFGMPGGNDPDCRRMMRFGSELSTIEKENFDVTKKLIQIRKSNMALLYGDLFEETETTENSMAFSRQYFDQFAWIGFNNSDSIITFKVFINPNVNEEQLKTNFGNVLKPFDKGFTVEIPPYSFEIITTN
jgi:glycosidase